MDVDMMARRGVDQSAAAGDALGAHCSFLSHSHKGECHMPCPVSSDIPIIVSLLLKPQESGNGGESMDARVPDHLRPYVKHELDDVSSWLEHAALGRCSATLEPVTVCSGCAAADAALPRRLHTLATSLEVLVSASRFERKRRRDGGGPHAHELGEAVLAALFGIRKLFGVRV